VQEDGVRTVIVIPARYASARYPGKPLVVLRGPDGPKTLIQRSWEAALAVRGISRVVVATDDDRIAEAVAGFGGEVVMTPDTCRNGTERCAAALPALGDVDLVVNLQGDAPLTPPAFVEALVDAMARRPDVEMATPVLRLEPATFLHFREDRAAGRVGGTTAVFAGDGRALYFSKEVIPFVAEGQVPDPIPVFHHVGVYAYRPAALRAYDSWAEGVLERHEGLEQLRFLENNAPVLCVEVEAEGRVFWELNNPVDVARIESVL
jgi:3-deoxy-manno-octulosonate cytidylyltransferase (CMP-KDO synthetase)